MKLKHIFIISLSTCLPGLSSCDLNITPDSYIPDSSFYKNEAEMNTAVIGCYGGMQAPLNIEWTLTELRADNTRMNSNSSTNDAFLQQQALDLGTMDASNANIRTYWEATYSNINSCNNVLAPENLAVVANEKKRAQFEGEACFIRAYHYFNLVRLFGPTFIITEELSVADAMKKDRSSVEATYQQIIDDLKTSIDDLEDVTYDVADLGRVTQPAAQSLLAKVYLTIGKYEEAKKLLKSVVDVKGDQLTVSYSDVFDISKEMNDEIIFAVRYKSGSLGIGSPFANTFAPTKSGANVVTGDGDGRNYPTTEVLGIYPEGDLRKEVSVSDHYIDPSKKDPVVISNQSAYIKKFVSPVSVRYDAENDWPVIRHADVLLMYAEVLNKIDGPAAGLPYLNEVRRRAGLGAIDISEVPVRSAFREKLEKERRLELAFENQRWFDLVRWGKALETINKQITETESFYGEYAFTVNPMAEWQLLLPIPQSVIDNNPSVITQNPHY
ncbi:RagB/SusD family nutrient uptake outer membrane protein [Bacteroides difficilis]|uniref:RagB/SusD family nutrient uptake outer membrane protein n=1 Tax=Bacteroides difficilis TaxID=2763021 RepID=UPI003AAE53C7